MAICNINKNPNATIHSMTPSKELTRKKLEILHLEVSRCISYEHILDDLTSKIHIKSFGMMDPKPKKCKFTIIHWRKKGMKATILSHKM